MKRFDIINFYISQRNFSSFLEIGTDMGETFRNVDCDTKVSVDPNPRTNATHIMTSDEFFARNKKKFDIVFIDGLHLHDQVWRDITNSLKFLNKNGMIILHDCNPENENMQRTDGNIPPLWTGDVWKAFVKARAELPYEMYVVRQDYGCGVIDTSKQRKRNVAGLPTDMDAMTWTDFVSNPKWMNFKDVP